MKLKYIRNMTSRNKNESNKGIKLSGSACIVCGWNEHTIDGKSLIEGAHVKAIETGKEFDKADNIIALCPNHHTEFDALNFYIDADTKKLFFCYNTVYNGKDVSNNTKHIQPEYLRYHKYLCDKKWKNLEHFI